MDKISGIVKASPRLTSVDLKDANPVRPGTPSFGRPEGVSSLTVAANLNSAVPSTSQKGATVQAEMMDWRTKDAQRAALATELSDRFFIKNKTEPAKGQAAQNMQPTDVPMTQMPAFAMREVRSNPAGFKSESFAAPGRMDRASTFADEEESGESAPTMMQPEGLYPKGSFIDRTV